MTAQKKETSQLNNKIKRNDYDQRLQEIQGGSLYVVATPIGHLSDLTFRALDVLKKVDWIACEDTRHTLKLLNYYCIEKRLLSIFGHKEKMLTPKILRLLQEYNSVALLTDAGTPGISDPGNFLVRQAIHSGIKINPIPGVSALSCAVSVSGCSENGFIFLGFVHRKKGKIKKEFKETLHQKKSVVFYESPYRVHKTLDLALEIFGEEAYCWIGREMTKKFEEYISGTLIEMINKLKDRKFLGEATIIIKP